MLSWGPVLLQTPFHTQTIENLPPASSSRSKKKRRKRKDVAAGATGTATAGARWEEERPPRYGFRSFWSKTDPARRQALVTVPSVELRNRLRERQRATCACEVCRRKQTAAGKDIEQLLSSLLAELAAWQCTQDPAAGQLSFDAYPVAALAEEPFMFSRSFTAEQDQLVLILDPSGQRLLHMLEGLTHLYDVRRNNLERQASSADMATDGDEAAATTTPAQCMAAGQRILQVFAAKMVEEKVLTAFREQQALEKQEQLIMEEAEQKRALLERTQAKEKAKLKNRQQQQQQRQAELEEKRRLEEAQVLAEEANRLQREERERFHEAEREQRRQADALRMQQLELEQQKKMMQERIRRAEEEKMARKAAEKEARKAGKKERRAVAAAAISSVSPPRQTPQSPASTWRGAPASPKHASGSPHLTAAARSPKQESPSPVVANASSTVPGNTVDSKAQDSLGDNSQVSGVLDAYLLPRGAPALPLVYGALPVPTEQHAGFAAMVSPFLATTSQSDSASPFYAPVFGPTAPSQIFAPTLPAVQLTTPIPLTAPIGAIGSGRKANAAPAPIGSSRPAAGTATVPLEPVLEIHSPPLVSPAVTASATWIEATTVAAAAVQHSSPDQLCERPTEGWPVLLSPESTSNSFPPPRQPANALAADNLFLPHAGSENHPPGTSGQPAAPFAAPWAAGAAVEGIWRSSPPAYGTMWPPQY